MVVDNQQQQQQNNDSNNNKSPSEKATQAYKLFDEGKKPVDVAIQLCLSEKEATRYYTEYWRLMHLYNLHSIYKELNGDLFPILRLYRLLKREGITTDKIEWFVHTVNTGMYKIPEIQKQYAKVKDELEAIGYKKAIAKYQLDDMNNQITYLNKISFNKRNEIAYLQIGAQELKSSSFSFVNLSISPSFSAMILLASSNSGEMVLIDSCWSSSLWKLLDSSSFWLTESPSARLVLAPFSLCVQLVAMRSCSSYSPIQPYLLPAFIYAPYIFEYMNPYGGFGGCNTQVYVIHDLITERRERIVKMFCDRIFVYGVDTIAAEDVQNMINSTCKII
jgi:hypothetical protein